jgi:hypothetical protein
MCRWTASHRAGALSARIERDLQEEVPCRAPPSLKAQALLVVQQHVGNLAAQGLDQIAQHVLASLPLHELQLFLASPHPEIQPWATQLYTQRSTTAALTLQRAFREARLRGSLSTPLSNVRAMWATAPHVRAHFQNNFPRFARAILDD